MAPFFDWTLLTRGEQVSYMLCMLFCRGARERNLSTAAGILSELFKHFLLGQIITMI